LGKWSKKKQPLFIEENKSSAQNQIRMSFFLILSHLVVNFIILFSSLIYPSPSVNLAGDAALTNIAVNPTTRLGASEKHSFPSSEIRMVTERLTGY
jgi:hypothetical protein